MSASTLIQMRDIGRVFQTGSVATHALKNISLDINQGDYVSISGPSGCGKSTLLSILGLLDTPTSGSFKINDIEVANFSPADRAKIRNREIGFVFQDFSLIGDLTIVENVELPLAYRKVAPATRREAAMACLKKVGMADRANDFPSHLSGGQQQRVAVARALVGEPSLILADEPTGNLDSKNGDAVMGLLTELNDAGVTICMVTHDSRYASYSKRVIHLKDGELTDEGTLPEVSEAESVEKESGTASEVV